MLEVHDLKNQVFQGLHFSIAPGEIAFLLGASGAGKSSFLRVLNGLTSYTHGTVTLDEKPIEYNGKKNLPQVSLVFQQFHLFGHISVIGNIEIVFQKVLNRFFPPAQQLNKVEITRRSLELLTQFGLESVAKKSIHSLSGGQQQRLAIARALVLRPQVLCFDEPTASLDPFLVKDIATLLQNLAKEGLAIIVSTHDMGLLKYCPGKLHFLSNGIITERVDSLDFASNPEKYPQLNQFLRG